MLTLAINYSPNIPVDVDNDPLEDVQGKPIAMHKIVTVMISI